VPWNQADTHWRTAYGVRVFTDCKMEPAMVHSDLNINIALQRQAERVRAVQAYGVTHKSEPAATSWPIDDARPNRQPAGQTRLGLAIAVGVIRTLMAVAASTGGVGGLLASLVR
jgi:hypothetical protein